MTTLRGGTRLLVVLLAACFLAACDPRPFPPPAIESFVHTREVPPLGAPVDAFDEAIVTITAADDLHHALAVKVAHRSEERDQGLAGVRDVPRGTGLLYLYADEQEGGISPANLAVPVDAAFADASGEIVAVLRVAPCLAGLPCVPVDPEVPYQAVLQVRAGWFTDHRIERGATLEIGPIGPARTVQG